LFRKTEDRRLGLVCDIPDVLGPFSAIDIGILARGHSEIRRPFFIWISSQKDNYRDLYDIIIAPTVFDVPIASFLFLASVMQCKPPQYCYADISLYELLVSSLSLH
jgi:hypothetical protein